MADCHGPGVNRWLVRMAEHRNGIALVPARTETQWFRVGVWEAADGALFLHGRLKFHLVDGSIAGGTLPTPVCLADYGRKAVHRLQTRGVAGTFVTWRAPPIAS
jgi:hypothetical protein